MGINSLRFFTVYGPGQRPDMAIHKFIRRIIAGDEIDVFGDGETYRDYTYIEDIVNGIRSAMEHFDGYNVFNIGSGNPVKLSEVVEIIGTLLDIEPEMKGLPIQPGDMSGTNADITRARQLLGYEPSADFRVGVAREIEWIRKIQI